VRLNLICISLYKI